MKSEIHLIGIQIYFSHYGKEYVSSLKGGKIEVYDGAAQLVRIYPKEVKINIKKLDLHLHFCCIIICNSQNLELK